MDNQISLNYHGTVITYNEMDNKWEFELRNKDRSATSLTLAKEAIDKPAPKDKKPFKRFEAYRSRYGDPLRLVTVTSITPGRGYRGEPQVWISIPETKKINGAVLPPKREKVSLVDLYEANPSNAATIKEIDRLRDEMEKKQKAVNDLTRLLTKVTLNPEDFD